MYLLLRNPPLRPPSRSRLPQSRVVLTILQGTSPRFFTDDFSPPGLPPVSPEYAAPESLFFEMMWQLAEAVLLEINSDVRKIGAEFWLSSTATSIAIDPNPEKRSRQAEVLGIDEGFDYATRRLTKFSEKNGIGFVPLTNSLRSYAVSNSVDLHYHERKNFRGGHWNSKGHAVVAKTISQRLCPSVSR